MVEALAAVSVFRLYAEPISVDGYLMKNYFVATKNVCRLLMIADHSCPPNDAIFWINVHASFVQVFHARLSRINGSIR